MKLKLAKPEVNNNMTGSRVKIYIFFRMTMSHATKTRSVPSILPSHAAQIHVQPPSGTSDVDIYPLTNYTFGEGLTDCFPVQESRDR